ncbi:caspase family protein [Kovacikia minuta CCNUW1]|uniref:caspase family protein n=1 Tax=Kovacikia minuta TaxID=2931930 RepID=UPI001CCE52C4|nr:caspase family protein [Kovacikia minuta]UBF27426.1 caspase family protein [Kovacikia minuta CCNUW1]
MGLNRREFLQQTGLALAVLGAGNLGLSPIGQRYYQALAAPTSRKLALLVGINQYRSGGLNGCVTDVNLQRELLVYRFGFQPQDILTLTDQQATREAIETAFVSHLIEQAKSEDVVVFHFSGYGGRVTVAGADNRVQNSLVPVDDGGTEGDVPVVNDLLERTLLILLRSLRTDKVTTILDTSYTYPGKPLQGNLRIRARPVQGLAQASDAALRLPTNLLNQDTSNSPRPPLSASSPPPFPGVLLTATGPDQLATEARWGGLSAGLFTYALTRQIWEATSATTLRVVLGRSKELVEQLASQEQQPQLGGQKSKEASLAPYHLSPVPLMGADGVLVGVEENGKTAQVWLGGVPANLLAQIGANSLLSVMPSIKDSSATPVARYLQILSRDGLTARAKLYEASSTPDSVGTVPSLQVGQFVRERVRVLPRNIGLTVALDSNLERIERVDAVSAFTAVPRVSSAIAGEQAADYLFSKIPTPQPTQVASAANLTGIGAVPAATQSSYGLFSLGQDAIPNTAGEGGEAIKVAVRRLVPRLQTLLAAKLLNLTVNEKSSLVAVRATLERLDPKPQPLQCRETVPTQSVKRNLAVPSAAIADDTGLLSLPVNSRIQYRLENQSSQLLYFVLLGLDSGGNLIALYTPFPPSVNAAEVTQNPSTQTRPNQEQASGTIAPGEILTLPATSPSFQWVLHGPDGIAETYLISSRAPFTQTLAALGTASRPTDDAPAFHVPANPLEVAQAVLQDLHQAGNVALQANGAPTDAFMLDMSAWASLRFIYQVVG